VVVLIRQVCYLLFAEFAILLSAFQISDPLLVGRAGLTFFVALVCTMALFEPEVRASVKFVKSRLSLSY
jgi:hypothetical protein